MSLNVPYLNAVHVTRKTQGYKWKDVDIFRKIKFQLVFFINCELVNNEKYCGLEGVIAKTSY